MVTRGLAALLLLAIACGDDRADDDDTSPTRPTCGPPTEFLAGLNEDRICRDIRVGARRPDDTAELKVRLPGPLWEMVQANQLTTSRRYDLPTEGVRVTLLEGPDVGAQECSDFYYPPEVERTRTATSGRIWLEMETLPDQTGAPSNEKASARVTLEGVVLEDDWNDAFVIDCMEVQGSVGWN